MGKPQAPTPPDPGAVGSAQTGTNISTAIANAIMGSVNQNSPYGSYSFDQTGTYKWTDPTSGKTYDIPRFTATTTLDPGEANIYNVNKDARFQMGLAARKQAGFLNDYMGKAPNFDTSAIEGRLAELGRSRLDPRFERERAATEARLTQQGLTPGTEAWNAQMAQLGQDKNDAYNQLYLGGRGQALSELMAIRNQPINETSALMSGSQVNTPQFQSVNMPRIPTVDQAGLQMQNYNQRMGLYNSKLGSWNDTMGSLFGLGSSAIMASDARLKTEIRKVGKAGNLDVCEYRYIWDEPGTTRRGYIAQDVAKTHPEAVVDMGGYLGLDYSKLPEVE